MAVPQWFNILSTVFHLISFIAAGGITLLGYKAYQMMKVNKYLHFSISFLLITISFVIMGLTNLILYLNLDRSVATISSIISMGFVLYAIFTIAGFLLLTVLTFKIRDVKIISIFTIGIIAALIFLPFIKIFHVILLILTLLLSYYFYSNCKKKKTMNAKLVFSAFTVMMLSHVFHLASGTSEVIFAIGNTLLVAGYIILLITLLRFK